VQEEEHHHPAIAITTGGPEHKEMPPKQIKQMTEGASIVESQDTLLETADAQKYKEPDKTDPLQPISSIGTKKIATTVRQTQ